MNRRRKRTQGVEKPRLLCLPGLRVLPAGGSTRFAEEDKSCPESRILGKDNLPDWGVVARNSVRIEILALTGFGCWPSGPRMVCWSHSFQPSSSPFNLALHSRPRSPLSVTS
jgi:hypothetical protein